MHIPYSKSRSPFAVTGAAGGGRLSVRGFVGTHRLGCRGGVVWVLIKPVKAGCPDKPFDASNQTDSLVRFRRNAFPMTETELKLMVSAAIMGDSSHPVSGYRTPAAIGIASAL